MFKNYIKFAKRNILKNKGVYGINIISLSLGLASCLLILLFILDEVSYDRYNQKADDIVRVVFKAEIGGEEISEAVVMPPVGPTLEKEFPEVLTAARLKQMNDPSLSYNNKIYRDFDFAYRIQIEWWVFLLAGFLTTLIALITIGFKSCKAASANPVKSLRTE